MMLQKRKIFLYDQLLPYYVIQFFPLVMILFAIFVWPEDSSLKIVYFVPTFVCYVVAKILEILDLKSDYFFTVVMRGVISGHSLKHLAAGIGSISLICFLREQKSTF
eukprot:TRINITY_DN4694_c0_g1_i1.p1 TRINITY_DN4694_c0_g1~~TRINITY_DN4694_c0_g1_i1.p1  ORF type:complete len:107 (+),score=22.64 TRINITY_DN4694_c0_g1_i1:144-464(+)